MVGYLITLGESSGQFHHQNVCHVLLASFLTAAQTRTKMGRYMGTEL